MGSPCSTGQSPVFETIANPGGASVEPTFYWLSSFTQYRLLFHGYGKRLNIPLNSHRCYLCKGNLSFGTYLNLCLPDGLVSLLPQVGTPIPHDDSEWVLSVYPSCYTVTMNRMGLRRNTPSLKFMSPIVGTGTSRLIHLVRVMWGTGSLIRAYLPRD